MMMNCDAAYKKMRRSMFLQDLLRLYIFHATRKNNARAQTVSQHTTIKLCFTEIMYSVGTAIFNVVFFAEKVPFCFALSELICIFAPSCGPQCLFLCTDDSHNDQEGVPRFHPFNRNRQFQNGRMNDAELPDPVCCTYAYGPRRIAAAYTAWVCCNYSFPLWCLAIPG